MTTTKPTIPPKKSRMISGSSLAPNLENYKRGVSREFFYWIGVTPDCPSESIDIGGINFPKVNEDLIRDPARPSGKKRIPVIGAIVPMSEERIKRICDRLPRSVIRFTDDKGQAEEPGTGKNLGDLYIRPRKGHLITIPSDKEVADRHKRGRATNPYVQRPNDEPACRYMFAVICPNQDRPSRGDSYPDVLEVTGLEWPE